MTDKVAILIQYRNRCHYIEMCLTRILANTTYPWHSIYLILVDDDSDNWVTERIEELVKQHSEKQIRLIKNTKRRGTTPSFIDFLADYSHCDFLLKLDSDLLVCRGWLSAAVDWLNEHPDVSLANFRLTYVAKEPIPDDPWMVYVDNLNGAIMFRNSLIPLIDMNTDNKWKYWTDANWQRKLSSEGHKLMIMPIDVEHIDSNAVFGAFGTTWEKGPHPLWLGNTKNKDEDEESVGQIFTNQLDSYADFDPAEAWPRAREIRHGKRIGEYQQKLMDQEGRLIK
jgi:glycosyltransferase involved in cell wall biosynthesis